MHEICIDLEANYSKIDELIASFEDNKSLEICFSYISDFKLTKILRECVIKLGDIYDVDSKWKSRLILIVDELNNNAIEYGSLDGERNKMYVKIEKEKEGVIFNVEVEDSGNGDFAKTASEMEGVKSTKNKAGFDNHNSIRGRGLFLIIQNIVDELYFKDSPRGGLVVGIRKYIKK